MVVVPAPRDHQGGRRQGSNSWSSVTRLTGVDQLDFSTRGADISISKGFGPLTPYAGVGRVWIKSEPRGSASSLSREKFSMSRGFIGVGLNLGGLNLNLEGDRTGDVNAWSIKTGFRF